MKNIKNFFQKIKIPELILATFLSILTLIGESYKIRDSWNLFLNYPTRTIFLFSIYTVVLYIVILTIKTIFRKISKKKKTNSKLTLFIFEKHPFLIPFIILLTLYLPYLVIKYPGTPGWDFYHFLNNYYNFDKALTQHFPLTYVFTCIYFIKFGLLIGNQNIGLFLLTLFHALFMISAFSLVFCYLKKWNIDYKFRWFLLLFYGLNPLFPHYSTTIYHDIIYSSLLLIYILLLTDFYFKKENVSKKRIITFSIISLLVCLTRKNGIFIVFPINCILLWKYRKEKIMIIKKILFIIPIIIFFITEALFSIRYSKTSYLEALAIPIQTISRYSRDYHEDITINQKENISMIINYDMIPLLYNPTLVDPARNSAGNYSANHEDIINFLGTWFVLFFNHPDSYIQAVINNTYQLYYPFEKTTYIFFYVKEEGNYDTIINFESPDVLIPPKNTLIKLNQMFESIPLLRYIDDPGYYSWLLFILLLFIKQKKKNIVPILPLIITFLCCLAGPTIDYNARYTFPIIFSILPLFAFYSITIQNNKKEVH